MTPRETLELDALIDRFAKEARDKKNSEAKKRTSQACVGALCHLRDRLNAVAKERRKLKMVVGGRR